MSAHLTACRTALIATALAVLGACDESPSTTTSSWQLDAARFPIVLERPVNVVAQADGSGVSEVPPNAAPVSAVEGLPSPDGRRVAIVRDGRLLVAEKDGQPSELAATRSLSAIGGLQWSPDSEYLLFQGSSSDDEPHLYVVDAAGAALNAVSGAIREPQVAGWSPDREHIALLSTTYPQGTPFGRVGVHVVRRDGSGLTLVGEYAVAQSDAIYDQAQWSPDGRRIAAVSAGTSDQPAGTAVLRPFGLSPSRVTPKANVG